jgi:hypothetical protein
MATKSDLRARLTPRSVVYSGRGSGGSAGGPTFGTGRGGSSRNSYSLPFNGPGSALQRTNGILFPFTPNISVAHQVEYSQYDLVHTNYQQNSYSRTRNPQIQVTGVFASQTPSEAAYTVGVMHFLRVMSKMNFGVRDNDAGTPPPVLEFSAYGTFNFHRIPVVLGSFQFVYEDGVDYVEVETSGEVVQIPTVMTISMDLLPQYSAAIQNGFNLNELASGSGYKGQGRGGFI